MRLHCGASRRRTLCMRPECAFNRRLFSMATNVRFTVGRRHFRSGTRCLNRFGPCGTVSFRNNMGRRLHAIACTNTSRLSFGFNISNRCRFSPCSKTHTSISCTRVAGAAVRGRSLVSCSFKGIGMSMSCLFSLDALLTKCAGRHRVSITLTVKPMLDSHLSRKCRLVGGLDDASLKTRFSIPMR